jgi:hypothetical protein
MKRRRPTVQQQIISVICAGERREFVMADWPEGEPLPTEERYPLIVVDQHRDHFQEVLYGVQALQTASQHCLPLCGMKPTVLTPRNPLNGHMWALLL